MSQVLVASSLTDRNGPIALWSGPAIGHLEPLCEEIEQRGGHRYFVVASVNASAKNTQRSEMDRDQGQNDDLSEHGNSPKIRAVETFPTVELPARHLPFEKVKTIRVRYLPAKPLPPRHLVLDEE